MMNNTWRFDSPSIHRWAVRTGGLTCLLLSSLPTMAQETAAERACADAIQGKVAWNQQGNTGWSPGNLQRLCRGTTNPPATVSCFQEQIRSHNDWSRGINACLGASGAGAGAGAPEGVAAAPTGRNVTTVTYGQGGQRQGHFRQITPRLWVEFDSTGTLTHRFEEVQRDDWSVYLLDRSRGVNLQLDLHTRKVMYSDATRPRAELYSIIRVSVDALSAPRPAAAADPAPIAAPASPPPPPPVAVEPLNGRTVGWIGYGQLGTLEVSGHLKRTGAREWKELDRSERRVLFTFEEVQRDEWSVYLVDRSRGVNLQIDLHTKKVMYSDAGSPRRELYQIVRMAKE